MQAVKLFRCRTLDSAQRLYRRVLDLLRASHLVSSCGRSVWPQRNDTDQRRHGDDREREEGELE
jgi:hypothetical protein